MSSYANGCMVVILSEENIEEFERYFDQENESGFLNTEITLAESELSEKSGCQKRTYDISCNTSLEACLIENEDNDIRDVCKNLGISYLNIDARNDEEDFNESIKYDSADGVCRYDVDSCMDGKISYDLKPDYEQITKDGNRIESLYLDNESIYAVFYKEDEDTYGVAFEYDTETGEGKQIKSGFSSYMAALVVLPSDEKAIGLIKPKSKSYKELVCESVEREYSRFYKAELKKTKEELITVENYRIRFFNELREFFCEETGNDYSNELKSRDFEALYHESPYILNNLYDYYLGTDYASINTHEKIVDFIEDFNDCEHADIVADRCESELE